MEKNKHVRISSVCGVTDARGRRGIIQKMFKHDMTVCDTMEEASYVYVEFDKPIKTVTGMMLHPSDIITEKQEALSLQMVADKIQAAMDKLDESNRELTDILADRYLVVGQKSDTNPEKNTATDIQVLVGRAFTVASAALSDCHMVLTAEMNTLKQQAKKDGRLCPVCHGAGKVLRSRACAEDDPPDPDDPTDYEPCVLCQGLGFVRND